METIIMTHPDPPIRTYLHYAHPHGILMMNPERMSWVLNHYIQVRYTKASREKERDQLEFDTCIYNFWPVLQCLFIHPNDLIEEGIGIVPFIKKMLDDGYVVRAVVDEFYIERRSAYQSFHFIHHIMISGYNEEQAIFYVNGYTDKRRYEMTISSIANFLKGLELTGKESLAFFKDSGYPYIAQRSIILEQMVRYVNSVNDDKDRPNAIYGMDAYKLFETRMEEFICCGSIDIRPFHLLYEHKKMMLVRIQYMLERQPLCGELIREYEQIVELAVTLRNLILKYELTSKKHELSRAHWLLCEIIAREKNFFEQFLDIMEHSC